MIEFLLLLLLFVAVVCGLMRKTNRGWVPALEVPRPVEVRKLEVASLTCVVIPLLLLLLFEFRAPNYSPRLFSYKNFDAAQTALTIGTFLVLATITAGLFVAWKFSTGRAAMLIGLGISVAATGVNIRMHDVRRAMAKALPSNTAEGIPIRFELADDLDDAELIINDVSFGKLPVETTVQNVFAKIPAWTEEPAEKEDDYHTEWVLSLIHI